ncbi:septum site-determining protein MinC [Halobacillus massiliensis]|uniref:septum site-determining protein MinC n=1 Tax=Halobacillus massiliensis TaxID=1926286 RepID=UPI0009E2ADDD|nr:septum site-determining protein MinC [Halobacillus massiliensis]
MSVKTQQIVTIKGTRDGLTLRLNDQCSFHDILKELEEKLSVGSGDETEEPMIRVNIQLGNRFLTSDQQDQLKEIVRERQKLVVERIDSNVITKAHALEWKEQTDVKPIVKTVRSGQVVEVKGDLLLLGDVNPGGRVTATGNIFIMGKLQGIAHAGRNGDTETVIAASYMKPNQLRIADQLSRAPEDSEEGVYNECGFIDQSESKIRVAPLQEVMKKKPDLVSYERRMLNG